MHDTGWRIAATTAGLMLAGAFYGALAGFLIFAIGLPFTPVPPDVETKVLIDGAVFVVAFLGAPIGAVTAPIIAWLLLRRVPLGRMFSACASGTVVGGVAGWIAMVLSQTESAVLLKAILTGVAGCLIAALRLRYRARRLEA